MEAAGFAAPAETAALVALLRVGAHAPGLYAERIDEGATARALLEADQGLLAAQLVDDAAGEIARWQELGIRVVTLLDADYPPNLRAVHDRPPVLFTVGRIEPGDARSIAVIGSRRASAAGLERARAIAEHLVDSGFMIVSGLAAGIDTAAHRTALDRARRTVAVIGTGLLHTYPRENAALQRQIAAHGLVVSQFWPETRPVGRNFPLRNAVMSGIALATIVVEASHTSGARTQVRAALGHGRPVLLARPLLDQSWARELAARPGVYVFRSPAELAERVAQLVSTDALVG